MLDDAAVEARLARKGVSWDARPTIRAPEQLVPPEFDRICVRATAADPAKRYASARALHDAVDAWLDGDRDLELRTRVAASLFERAHTTRETNRDEALQDVNRGLALSPDDPRGLELLLDLLNHVPAGFAEKARDEVRSESVARLRKAQPLGVFLMTVPWLTIYPLVALKRGVTSWWLALVPPLAWMLSALGMLIDHRRGTQDLSLIHI